MLKHHTMLNWTIPWNAAKKVSTATFVILAMMTSTQEWWVIFRIRKWRWLYWGAGNSAIFSRNYIQSSLHRPQKPPGCDIPSLDFQELCVKLKSSPAVTAQQTTRNSILSNLETSDAGVNWCHKQADLYMIMIETYSSFPKIEKCRKIWHIYHQILHAHLASSSFESLLLQLFSPNTITEIDQNIAFSISDTIIHISADTHIQRQHHIPTTLRLCLQLDKEKCVMWVECVYIAPGQSTWLSYATACTRRMQEIS